MPPSSRMADELKFQQRWEFRRKEDEFGSSSDELKSSLNGEPVLKNHNLVAGLISPDNDETSNTSKLEQNNNYNPDLEAQTQTEQAKEKKTKRRRKSNLATSEMKRGSHQKVNRKKRKTGAYDSTAALDDIRNFADSLLEDLKVTRENLFVKMREEMNKLLADTAPKRQRRKRTSGGKKLQVQHQNNLEENIQLQNHSNFEENIQLQPANNNGAIVQVQQQNGFEEDTQVQHQGKFKSSTRARKCNGGLSERFAKSKKPAESKNDRQAVAGPGQVEYGQETGLYTSTEKEKGESLAFKVNSNVQSGSSNQNVQMQQPKSVVLAIRAQNSKDKSSERSAKGKKISDSNKGSGFSQAIVPMASTEKDTAEGLRFSAEQSFSSIPSNQVASSSMYLTLPSVLATPHDSNNRLETSLCNYIQPRVAGSKTGVNLERANQMLDPGTQYGYLTSMQPEERNGTFAQMGSRLMSYFDQNTIPTSSTGTGFPVPLQQSMDGGFSIPNQFRSQNLPRDNSNSLGLRMNGGGIMFSGGGYSLSDQHFVGNNFQSHSNHKADGRLVPYRIPTIQDSYLFPK